ncbi:hypothetical protein EJ08DRAFT_663537 [Tothia fuscella]|uniref:Glycine cleavage system H protein n=1 Tax=Tothia fuscella TaxID=1048955 RepID=A0A9P4NKV6_9PEZI|nr:hypothetical protein EJ08DRAFT_663537 [Tothia fuscella]
MAARICLARTSRSVSSIPTSFSRFAVKRVNVGAQLRSARAFSISAVVQEKKYTKDHEWVELGSDNKTVTLGISKYAAEALGDVIYVELPETGLEVNFDDAVGAVESVKSASDINTPFSGKVIESNGALEEKPGLLNQDPEGEAWIAKLEVENAGEEIGKLMDAEAYKAFTEESS